MANYTKQLDVTQGFDFKKDKQQPVGFLTALTIGGQKLEADMTTVMDPLNPTAALKSGVVGVLNFINWDASTTGSITFSGQISAENRQKIAEMLLGTWADSSVEFEFTICEYEQSTKKYFKSAYVDGALKGLIEKNGADLNISVADDPSYEVQSPLNYALNMGIKPQSIEQQIYLAVGEKRKVAKKWGITEKAA